MIACPPAASAFDKEIIEAPVGFARAGVPILPFPMSIGGLFSPVTVSDMMLMSRNMRIEASEVQFGHAQGLDV